MQTTTHQAPFEGAIADVHGWLDEICAELGSHDRRSALHALRAGLHALRDRLGVEQNAHLSAQLPVIVRGLYFEGWRPGRAETRDRTQAAYLADIASEFEKASDDRGAAAVARAVHTVLARHVSPGELRKIVGNLPHAVRALWGEAS